MSGYILLHSKVRQSCENMSTLLTVRRCEAEFVVASLLSLYVISAILLYLM
jgi:hypothetical protein